MFYFPKLLRVSIGRWICLVLNTIPCAFTFCIRNCWHSSVKVLFSFALCRIVFLRLLYFNVWNRMATETWLNQLFYIDYLSNNLLWTNLWSRMRFLCVFHSFLIFTRMWPIPSYFYISTSLLDIQTILAFIIKRGTLKYLYTLEYAITEKELIGDAKRTRTRVTFTCLILS